MAKEQQKALRGTARHKRIKWSIFLSGISVFAQLYAFQALLSQISEEFGITPSQSSYTISASTFGMAAGLLIYAFIADSYSRRHIILVSLFSTSLVTLCMPFTMNFTFLVVLNFVKGMFISGVSAVTLAYLAEEVSGKAIGAAISFYLAGNTFGGMFGRVFTGLIGSYWSWEVALFSVGFMGLLIAFACLRFLPESLFFKRQKKRFTEELEQLKSKLTRSDLWGLYFLGFCIMGIFVSIYNYLGFKLEEPPYNLPSSLVAVLFLMYAFGIGGNLIAGFLSDRYSSRVLLHLFLFILLVSLSLMMLPSLVWILIGLMLLTVAFFSAHTVAGRLITLLSPSGTTAATSMYWLFYYIGSSTIGTSSGLFINEGRWNSFFLSLMALAIAALVVANLSIKKADSTR